MGYINVGFKVKEKNTHLASDDIYKKIQNSEAFNVIRESMHDSTSEYKIEGDTHYLGSIFDGYLYGLSLRFKGNALKYINNEKILKLKSNVSFNCTTDDKKYAATYYYDEKLNKYIFAMSNDYFFSKLDYLDEVLNLKEDDLLYAYFDDDGDGIYYFKTKYGFKSYHCRNYDFHDMIVDKFQDYKISLGIQWNEEHTKYEGYNGKFECVYAGLGGALLRINKNIYNDYVNYCKGIDHIDIYETFKKMLESQNNKQ